MTKEEREKAIDLLDNLLGMVEDNQDSDYDKALRMGIQAIKTVEDFENAQIITGGRLNGRTYAYKCGLADGIRKVSNSKFWEFVKPTPKWIPVKERLPKESLNSVIGWDAYRERCVFVQYIDGCFQITGKDESFDIIAWMPLPEPYEEKQGNKVGWSNLENVREKIEIKRG